MTRTLPFAIVQTALFIRILAGDDPLTFQTFSDRDELKIKRLGQRDCDPNASWKHGTLKELKPYLERLNAKGAGVYVMVNEGDGKGRATKNVIRVRALFIDTDGAPFPPDLPLKPHLVVESSPGRWHLYWLIDGLELSDFSTLQEALAEHYGTDKSVKDLPRVLRLPGSYHCKRGQVMVRLLDTHDHQPYMPADIFAVWPFLLERLEKVRRVETEKQQQRGSILARAAERKANPPLNSGKQVRAERLLLSHHDTVAAAGDGTRHSTLLRAARALGGYVVTGALERSEVEDALAAAAEACGLLDGEAKGAIAWGLDKGAEDPLELSANKPQLFSAKPTFGAAKGAPNLLRPLQLKTDSGQPGSHTRISHKKSSLDGKPCR